MFTQASRDVGKLSNSECFSDVEDMSGGAGVSSVSKSGTTQTEVKAPKY